MKWKFFGTIYDRSVLGEINEVFLVVYEMLSQAELGVGRNCDPIKTRKSETVDKQAKRN